MLYLVALIIPPLAILLTGKIFQAIINGVIWLVGMIGVISIIGSGFGFGAHIFCLIHAVLAINSHNQDKRNDKIIDAIERNSDD